MTRSTAFQFRAGNSFFHRLDPLTKFVWLLAISLLAFGAYIAWVQIVITLGCSLPLSLSRGCRPGDAARHLAVPGLPSFLVIQTLTLPGTLWSFTFRQADLRRKRRLRPGLGPTHLHDHPLPLVFVRTTDPRELAIALVTQMRVPYRIAYAFFIALRIIPTIEEEIKMIHAAQAVRGVASGGVAARIGEKRYAIPLLVGSLRRLR